MKKVYKYGTGHEVPKDAVYLCTKVQRKILPQPTPPDEKWVDCWLVWHYFLVDEKE